VDQGFAGFVEGYHVQDAKTGRMLSIIIWDSEESMEALRDLTPQGGSLEIRTDREELFDVVEKYQDATCVFTRVSRNLVLRTSYVRNSRK
jgi:hypothetical protein